MNLDKKFEIENEKRINYSVVEDRYLQDARTEKDS